MHMTHAFEPSHRQQCFRQLRTRWCRNHSAARAPTAPVSAALAAALTPVRELPLSCVAADARGLGASSGGWRRTCECGIWLGVAQWELQAGVCACGRRLLYKRARDGPSQSLVVPLVPRVPRPMPDGYG